MSIGFDILISPSACEVTPLEFYEQLLDVVLGSSHVRHVGLQLTVYRRQGPFELGPESKDRNIAVNERFDRIITAQQVRKIVEEVRENDVYVNASLTYDRLRWNNDKPWSIRCQLSLLGYIDSFYLRLLDELLRLP